MACMRKRSEGRTLTRRKPKQPSPREVALQPKHFDSGATTLSQVSTSADDSDLQHPGATPQFQYDAVCLLGGQEFFSHGEDTSIQGVPSMSSPPEAAVQADAEVFDDDSGAAVAAKASTDAVVPSFWQPVQVDTKTSAPATVPCPHEETWGGFLANGSPTTTAEQGEAHQQNVARELSTELTSPVPAAAVAAASSRLAVNRAGGQLRRAGTIQAVAPEQLPAESSTASVSPQAVQFGPPLEPNFSNHHAFAGQCWRSGILTLGRRFTKVVTDRFSTVVVEDSVHFGGTVKYLVQFTHGSMSSANGVGFTFADDLKETCDIRSLTSIFLNKHGYVCFRTRNIITKLSDHVKTLEIGDWIELFVDLNYGVARFTVYPHFRDGVKSLTTNFAERIRGIEKAARLSPAIDLTRGCLSCVVRHASTSLTLGS